MENRLRMPIINSREYRKLRRANDFEGIQRRMEELGWSRNLTFEWCGWDAVQNVFTITTYYADANRLSCSCPSSSSALYLVKMPTGINSSCASCRKTNSATDISIFEVLETRIVTGKEALEHVEANNQQLFGALANYSDIRPVKAMVWT